MKKLLLVLAVVAMASFLFVGCLPGGTTPGTDTDTDTDVVPTVTISVEDQAIIGDKTYVRADDLDVTVKFTEAVPADKAVWVSLDDITYVATTAKTVARLEFVTDTALAFTGDCAPVCIYVKVGDICCTDEEYSQVVVVDGLDPYATVVLDVDTCSCTDEANFTFSGTKKTTCGYEGCCDDACSGFDAWTIKIWPADADKDCDDPCFEDTGACPVSSTTACLDCLLFSDTEEANVFYDVDYTLVDNVGNKVSDTWVVELDTDSVVSIDEIAEASLVVDLNGDYILLDPECPTE